MFREFNVKFEDVEMLGGADNLLEGTEITKVIVRGDNNKMSSLDSMLKNCNELDTIDGELDLNGVSDIDNLLEGTELVKSIDLKNINNENISANNSFPHVDRINIGGELYNKKAMQNVIASKDWTFDNINYSGTVGDNIVTKEVNIVDDNKTTIQDTLEQKARGIEIIGQTYENLVVGSGEATLLDELTLESVDGNSKEFNPHLEQPVCVETIEGETYQNLIEGRGEYKLTDTFSTTWTESNNSIENPPSMIEIPEIWGNTVQGYCDLLSAKDFVEHFNNIKWTSSYIYAEHYSDNTFKVIRNINYFADEIRDSIASDNSKAIKLKPSTKYTIWVDNGNCSLIVSTPNSVILDSVETRLGSYTFTTDSTGLIGIGLKNTNSTLKMKIRLIEGEIANLHEISHDFNVNYIQSVGDLYVDESGEPILDEEGNEQYKLEIESANNINLINPNNWTPTGTASDHIQIIKLEPNTKYIYYGNQSSNVGVWHSLVFCDIDGNESEVLFNAHCPANNVYKFTTGDYQYVKVGWGTSINNINTKFLPMLTKGSTVLPYIEGTGNNQSNKTTILMPQPLRKIKYATWGKEYLLEDKLRYENGKYILDRASELHYLKPYLNNLGNSIGAGNVGFKRYVLNVTLEGHLVEDIDSLILLQNSTNYKGIPLLKGWGRPVGNVYWETKRCYSFDCVSNNGSLEYRFQFLLEDSLTREDLLAMLDDSYVIIGNYKDAFRNDENRAEVPYFETVETKILEKPSLETYSPKTYITTNTEIQPSQMSITNKKVDYIPLGLQPNKDYTLQLDSIGKDDKSITVNLGGTEATIQPINDTSKHHKVVVRTPSTLTTDKLDLNGEGVVVNDVMLFEGGSNEIKQEVEYVEGIESIGELVENLFPIDVIENIKTNYDEYKNNYYKKEIQLQPNTTYSVRYLGKSRGYGYGLIIGGKENITGSHSWLCDMNLNSGITTKTFTTDLTGKLTFGISFIGIDSISSFLRQETKVQIEIGNNVSSEYFEGERYKIDILTDNGSHNLLDINVGVSSNGYSYVYNGYIEVEGGGEYYSYDNGGLSTSTTVICYDSNKSQVTRVNTPAKVPNNCKYIKPDFAGLPPREPMVVKGNKKQPYTNVLRKETTRSILLPQPLNKIGGIKDKFYWDDNKGHYCIEENIGVFNLDDILLKSNFTDDSMIPNHKIIFISRTALNIDCSSHFTGVPFMSDRCAIVNFTTNSLDYKMIFMRGSNDIRLGIRKDIYDRVGDKESKNMFIGGIYYYPKDTPNIIDLPHLNKKYSLDTYIPTTYLECTNNPMQPSRLLLESDTVRYKPSALETDTDYTVQFECKEKSDKKVKLNLGGTEKEVDVEVGLNHVSITTPSEIDTSLYKDRLFLSGVGNKVADVIVAKGEMNQYPRYFNGVQNTGELQDDGTYKIDVSTNNGGFKNLFDINNFFVNSNNRGELIISSEDNSITSNYTDWFYTVETNIDLKAGKEYLINLDFEGTTAHTSKYALIMLGDKGYNLNSYNHVDFEKVIEHTPYTEQDLKASFNIVYTPSSDKTIYFGLSTGLRTGGSIKIKNIEIAEYNDNLNMDIPLKSHNVAITSNNPLAKGDKLYWNKSNKRYEIDRSGSVEVPTVSGDIIDLPRLYQREDTHFSTSTGNIKPSKVKLDYNDLD